MSRPKPGQSQTLADGLRRVLAPNPGPMTHWGTNTFIVGEGRVAIVDPGPINEAHLEALLSATKGETITHILVTHAHADHSPLARRLSEKTGAPVLGFGPAEAGCSAVMTRLANAGLIGGGEGVDHSFLPDEEMADGDTVRGDGWSIDVLHTPGHFAGHLAFSIDDALMTGDHVMEWASTLVSPPDGDLGAFMETSRRLKKLDGKRFFPAHGSELTNPSARLDWLILHRMARETEILNALSARPISLNDLTGKVYDDVPAVMLPMAARNVLAHLIDLHERQRVIATPVLSATATFHIA